ncbi:heme exporter protein CcmD, partial [Bosea sp. TAB14]|uniref:heme exporter protein CcmD n=1 Tax=Bosea sp. TAB14 TaxID=3237481 RepID=UPI003F915303
RLDRPARPAVGAGCAGMTALATSRGPHAGFILAAGAAVVVVLTGLTLSIIRDHRAQKRALAALEQRGAGLERRHELAA